MLTTTGSKLYTEANLGIEHCRNSNYVYFIYAYLLIVLKNKKECIAN
jgi:hypothetical protein